MLKGKYVLLDFKSIPDRAQSVWYVAEEYTDTLVLHSDGGAVTRTVKGRVIACSPIKAEMEALTIAIGREGNKAVKARLKAEEKFQDALLQLCRKDSVCVI